MPHRCHYRHAYQTVLVVEDTKWQQDWRNSKSKTIDPNDFSVSGSPVTACRTRPASIGLGTYLARAFPVRRCALATCTASAAVAAVAGLSHLSTSIVLDRALHPLPIGRKIPIARACRPRIDDMSHIVRLHRIAGTERDRVLAVDVLAACAQAVARDKDDKHHAGSRCISDQCIIPPSRYRAHRVTHLSRPSVPSRFVTGMN